MKNNILVLIIFSIAGLQSALGQITLNDSNYYLKKIKKNDYSFTLGSSVGFSSDRSFIFHNYFSPSKSFQLNKKFNLTTGIGVSNTQWNNIPEFNNEFQLITTDINYSSIYFYTASSYKLSPKLNLNSTVRVEHLFIHSDNELNADNMQTNFKDLSIGFDYQVTSHFSFNAQMHFTDRPFNAWGYQNFYFMNPPNNYFPNY